MSSNPECSPCGSHSKFSNGNAPRTIINETFKHDMDTEQRKHHAPVKIGDTCCRSSRQRTIELAAGVVGVAARPRTG